MPSLQDEWKDGPIFQTGPRVLGEVFSQQLGLGVSNFWRLGFDGGIFHYRDMVLRVRCAVGGTAACSRLCVSCCLVSTSQLH